MSTAEGLRISIACVGAVLAGLLVNPAANADFALNWGANGTVTPFINTLGCTTATACGVYHYNSSTGGQITCSTDSTLCDQTPFLYEKVTVSGTDYLHMVIGDPTAAENGNGFAQEVYIQTGTSLHYEGAALATAGFIPGTAGGGLSAYSSSSLGTCGASTGNPATCVPGATTLDNGKAPLNADSTLTGNGSGNPTHVQMRQLLTESGVTIDFVKDKFAEKPSITNSIQTSDFSSVFSMDSTGNTYSSTTPSTVTNTVDILDPSIPADSAHFDTATGAQQSTVTAGAYTYTANPTYPNSTIYGGAGGTYSYVDGGAAPAPDWKSFFDANQTNPWSFQQDRP